VDRSECYFVGALKEASCKTGLLLGVSAVQRRKLFKRVTALTTKFLDRHGHDDRVACFSHIVYSFNADVYEGYTLWPVSRSAPMRLRGGEAAAVRLCVNISLLLHGEFSESESKKNSVKKDPA
jgi:hypothetical protein